MHNHRHKHATLAQSDPPGSGTATQTAASSGDKDNKAQLVYEEEIRIRAYRKWESAGKPIGDGIPFWLEAEQELVQGK